MIRSGADWIWALYSGDLAMAKHQGKLSYVSGRTSTTVVLKIVS